jgi:hypothetical protein
MDIEHRLRQRIGVLSGGGVISMKMEADSNIGIGTLLVEERNPSLVGVQSPALAVEIALTW